MNKSFLILLIGATIWGVSLGLAFIGGIAVGSTGSEEVLATDNVSAAPVQSLSGQQGQLDPNQREQLRQRIQSGEVSQEELNQTRRQFQGQGGPGGQGGGQRFQGGEPGGQPPQQGSN